MVLHLLGLLGENFIRGVGMCRDLYFFLGGEEGCSVEGGLLGVGRSGEKITSGWGGMN